MLLPHEQLYFILEEKTKFQNLTYGEAIERKEISDSLGITPCDTCEKQGVLYNKESIEVCPTCFGIGEKGHSKGLRDAILLGKEDKLGEFWGENK